ncbi:c-type cytochrome [Chthonobacter rhizosphaerae]|uniref:c-type cytochrome n=1 Tax=Chthonobacter rhizosphaerae TaxID=2735553 RepID=UPI0015EFAA05|nr:c-type cytochrome [Chthonobacter rhizosphaerae]
MILTVRRAVLAVLALAAAGMLFAWSGLFNVAASTGHWPITNWFLHWVMQNSVRTYALATVETPPPLDDPALLPAAAGHYAQGCAWCHAAPGEPQSQIAEAMTPPPPALHEWLAHVDWTDKELHRIVEHGVKYSGMPAWPSLKRPDEVWAMVAFLDRLPDMDEATYRTLAYGEAGTTPVSGDAAFDRALGDCARCHGTDGAGRSDRIPVIGGQKPVYLAASLRAYAAGERASGFMQGAVADLSVETLDRLAEHYASQTPARPQPALDANPGEVERGRVIAEAGVPIDGVPACLSCHGEGRPRDVHFPRLDGQHRDYLARQLSLFREGERGGSPYARLMTAAVHELKDEDLEAVAAYFASRGGALAAR